MEMALAVQYIFLILCKNRDVTDSLSIYLFIWCIEFVTADSENWLNNFTKLRINVYSVYE